MAQWTITDFLGNTVTVQADGLQTALDTAFDEHRRDLFGNAEHWEITSDTGEHHPRQRDYDWDTNALDHGTQA